MSAPKLGDARFARCFYRYREFAVRVDLLHSAEIIDPLSARCPCVQYVAVGKHVLYIYVRSDAVRASEAEREIDLRAQVQSPVVRIQLV